MMSAIDRIRTALVRYKGFAPLDISESPPSLQDASFALVAHYFGVPVVVVALAADQLSLADLERAAQDYWLLLRDARRRAPPGPGGVRQITGQLWLFHSDRCPPGRLAAVRRLKRLRLVPPVYLLPWVFDLREGRVQRHRGLPFMRWPGIEFLTAELRAGERAA